MTNLKNTTKKLKKGGINNMELNRSRTGFISPDMWFYYSEYRRPLTYKYRTLKSNIMNLLNIFKRTSKLESQLLSLETSLLSLETSLKSVQYALEDLQALHTWVISNPAKFRKGNIVTEHSHIEGQTVPAEHRLTISDVKVNISRPYSNYGAEIGERKYQYSYTAIDHDGRTNEYRENTLMGV